MPSITVRLFFSWLLALPLAAVLLSALPSTATATDYHADVLNDAKQFVQANSNTQVQLLQQWTAAPTHKRLALLVALQQGRVGANQYKQAFIEENGNWLAVSEPIIGADEPTHLRFNNRLRGLINTAVASHQLLASDARLRLMAVQQLQRNTPASLLPLLEQQLVNETDSKVKEALLMVLASLQLQDSAAAVRLAAVRRLGASSDPQAAKRLSLLLEAGEPDADVRHAAEVSLRKINSQLMLGDMLGHLFSGLSLGSILLLAALGLAITFGLLGIINMAHGEMLMIGAYTTYMVQILIQQYVPQLLNYYPLFALPIAFIVTAAVGMALERTVIRHLYGRPLETLLATWWASLILIQTVRLMFGAQNVEVANPEWLTGGMQVLPNLLLPYNRMAIVVFALLVVLFTWILLNKTRLGLNLRAVTQNRNMAACCGVKTGQVDMLAFGLGSGIAGLGGVALSQIGNVGPDLGQTYIIDSFLVVVLGGIGQLAGTLFAALGLGVISKFLEPQIGAVLGKILILALIILVIQKRPQGLFALKGRTID